MKKRIAVIVAVVVTVGIDVGDIVQPTSHLSRVNLSPGTKCKEQQRQQ